MESKEINITSITPNKHYVCLDCYFNHIQSLLKERGANEIIISKIKAKLKQKTSTSLIQKDCLLCYKKDFAISVGALDRSFVILKQINFSIQR